MLDQKNNKDDELINIQWLADEFEKHQKSTSWYITAGVIALIFFAIALLMENFIFAILIILSAFTVFVYAKKNPCRINFKIDGQGITINAKLHEYHTLESFWIFYQPPQTKELSIKSKNWTTPIIKIRLEGQDPVAIRRALINFIPEVKHEESLIDILVKKSKF